jgi:CP family cyanate transporter-like MFS transporter
VILISIVLRPAVSSIGPLLNDINNHWSLDSLQTSLLVSMPVVCFGLGAFAAPWLVNRLGLQSSVSVLLAVLTLGVAFRAWFDFGWMVAVSLLAAVSIALLNVVLPSVIRADFRDDVAKMTGIYTSVAALFASVSSLFAVPLASLLGSFQSSLTFWAAPSLLAFVVWLLYSANRKKRHLEEVHKVQRSSLVLKSRMTWAITGMFGIQSANFYALINWLPSLFVSRGYSEFEGGIWTAAATAVGIPLGFLVTQSLKRIRNLTVFSASVSIWTAIGFCLMAASDQLLILGSMWVGIGLGITFPLALAFIGMKGANQAQTTMLSAVSQGVGYLIAAVGAFLMGVLYGATGTWTASLLTLAASAVVQAFCAGYAASKRPL